LCHKPKGYDPLLKAIGYRIGYRHLLSVSWSLPAYKWCIGEYLWDSDYYLITVELHKTADPPDYTLGMIQNIHS
jgi:hypothetical protein